MTHQNQHILTVMTVYLGMASICTSKFLRTSIKSEEFIYKDMPRTEEKFNVNKVQSKIYCLRNMSTKNVIIFNNNVLF